MKKVIFCVNIPSPYRVDFFNELGKYCDLTVCYERRSSSERDDKWKGAGALTYNEVMLDSKPVEVDRTIGLGLCNYLRKHKSDILVFGNSFSPSGLLAIIWCRLCHREYYLESDGGFFKRARFPKNLIKRFIRKGSVGYFETCEESLRALWEAGYPKEKIFIYPFSSVSEKDICNVSGVTEETVQGYKKSLQIPERKMVLAVGQFIHRKGFDVLIDAFSKMTTKDVGLYIIGGNPTEEYLIQVGSLGLKNVHFSGFKSKSELAEYYKACDVVAFPTREDIWGLITNEAMSYGKPVVATDRCNSALEMIDNGTNGYVVPVGNSDALAEKIDVVLTDGIDKYATDCIATAHRYTIETMVAAHLKVWNINQ